MKASAEPIWIIVGTILAIVGLIVSIMIFSGRLGSAVKRTTNITQKEVEGLSGEQCESIVLQRRCYDKECPIGTLRVNAKCPPEKVCCETQP